MSADTGPKKRSKDKKRKKGGVDISAPAPMIVQKDVHPMKLISDENMHVHKETKFGGNILSKLIFFVVLLAIGAALCFSFANKGNSEDDEKNESSWLPDYFNFGSFFSTHEPPEPPVDVNDEDEISENKLETSFLESLWSSVPFFRQEKPDSDEDEINRSFDSESTDSKDDLNTDQDEDEQNSLDDEENEPNEEKDDDGSSRHDYDDENDDDDAEKENDKEDDDYNQDQDLLVDRNRKDQNSDDDYDDDSDEERNDKELNDDDELPYPQESSQVKYSYFENEDLKDENENDDDDDTNDEEEAEEGYSRNEDDRDNDFNEILEQSDPEESKESADDVAPDANADSEQTATNVVTKLGVGIALMFVAYSVIIRKWEDYEILVPPIVEDEEYELPDDIENDNNATDQTYSFDANQLLDDEFQNLQKNETTHSETASESESEDISDSVMRWSASNSADILANEISDSELTASESVDNSDIEAESFQNQYMPEDYEKSNITNAYDWRFKDELDQADQDFDNHRFAESLSRYERILRTYPHSARAKFGVAASLDAKAESRQSNQLLAGAIEAYVDALLAPDMPDSLFKAAGERVIDRMRFKGEYESCINIQNLLIERFPHSVGYQNDLVVSLLMLNRMQEAKRRLEQILLSWPDNGLALVHYGFVSKLDGDLPAAVLYLSKGIRSNESGTQEGRFYFHLGDALQRLGRNEEATELYRRAVDKGIFLSEYQRSLYNVKRLTGRPWWTVQQTTYGSFFSKLEKNWEIIRNEGVSLLKQQNSTFTEESEQLRETGDWKQFELFSRGSKRSQCHKAPRTCQLVSEFEPAAGCRRGQVKFSVMEPGTHVWPHCGPTNCRLRAHLGLVVPSNVTIRVASETRQWKEGEIFVFDDSFEHEVWHNGSSWRLILIIDVWHPELTMRERRTLASI